MRLFRGTGRGKKVSFALVRVLMSLRGWMSVELIKLMKVLAQTALQVDGVG